MEVYMCRGGESRGFCPTLKRKSLKHPHSARLLPRYGEVLFEFFDDDFYFLCEQFHVLFLRFMIVWLSLKVYNLVSVCLYLVYLSNHSGKGGCEKELLLKDQSHFMRRRWRHLVLDEVQLIKNMTEKHWETIFNIKRLGNMPKH